MVLSHFIVTISLLIIATSAIQFQFLNTVDADIWIGIQGNPGHPNLNQGGLIIKPGQRVSV